MNWFLCQPFGPGKYIFDVGCMQYGEYISVEQVKPHFLHFTLSIFVLFAAAVKTFMFRTDHCSRYFFLYCEGRP